MNLILNNPNFVKKLSSPIRKFIRIIREYLIKWVLTRAFQEDYEIAKRADRRFKIVIRRPMLGDKNTSLPFDRHYFYHPSWAARVLAETRPQKHVDISSIIRFVGDISAFIPTDYYEFQPPKVELEGLELHKIDLISMPFHDSSINSLSCMHVVEHVGLGRYGDAFDLEGDIKACRELQRVLAPSGQLLFVVPVAEIPRLEFNAHRVYSYDMVLSMLPNLNLAEFALIPDKVEQGGLIRHGESGMLKGQTYACGCFHFIKVDVEKGSL